MKARRALRAISGFGRAVAPRLRQAAALAAVGLIVFSVVSPLQAYAQTPPAGAQPGTPGTLTPEQITSQLLYGNAEQYVPNDGPLGPPACGPGTGSGPAACAGLQGRDKEEQAYNFFRGKGLSAMRASAIVGNLKLESGLDPTAVNRSSGATGIAQWLGGRLNSMDPKLGLKGYANAAGKNFLDFCVQLDFLWFEVTDGAEKRTQVLQVMEQAEQQMAGQPPREIINRLAYLWEDLFERSGGAAIGQRQNYAWQTFQTYGGGSGTPGAPTGTPPPVGGGTTCAGGGGGVASIVQKAIELAWPCPFRDACVPRQERSSAITPKPAYTTAIQRSNPGMNPADCGVFVATVMRDSKADPNYPPVGTSIQYEYMSKHPELYDRIPGITDTSQLSPGDIVIVTAGQSGNAFGHTWIYVGQVGNYFAASASLNSRAGNLGRESIGGYTVFRLKQQ
jgi:hypothetical protein